MTTDSNQLSPQANGETRPLAPDVCECVEYGLDSFGREPETWRVTGWMRAAQRPDFGDGDELSEILFDACHEHVDGKRMQYCLREEAEYLVLYGICGAIAPVEQCRVIGVVDWSDADIKRARDGAIRRGQAREMLR